MKTRNVRLFAAGVVATTSVLTSVAAFAAYPTIEEPVAVDHSGFYVGGEVGWGRQDANSGSRQEPTFFDSTGAVVVNPLTAGNWVRLRGGSDDGWAGRINIGYNINQFFAVELGGGAWSDADYKWRAYDPTNTVFLGNGTGDVNSYMVDLLAKVTYPFENGFKVFAKGGGAYVWSNTDIKRTLIPFAPFVRTKADSSESEVRPEAAAGIGYNIDDNWSVSAQYTYIWGNNNNPLRGDNIPDLQMATVGVQYDVV